jgi:hypothetical protein
MRLTCTERWQTLTAVLSALSWVDMHDFRLKALGPRIGAATYCRSQQSRHGPLLPQTTDCAGRRRPVRPSQDALPLPHQQKSAAITLKA